LIVMSGPFDSLRSLRAIGAVTLAREKPMTGSAPTAPAESLFTLARAIVYGACFTGLLLVYLPAAVLRAAGIERPPAFGTWQALGAIAGAAGAALAISCILTFVFVGRGTQAPFDPPRRLVVGGPYRLLRNPMYLGAALAMTGAAIFYQSPALFAYAAALALATHVMVVGYEEPTLRRTFGAEYLAYCRQVPRWWIA
jgi:protein-S-isoprenylcysteine O-methyltransferase Ste14